MKNYILLSLLAGSLAIYSCETKPKETTSSADSTASTTDTTEDVGEKKYPIKSGIVTFQTTIEIEGAKIEEKKLLYFDDYGMKEAEDTYEGNVHTKTYLSDGKNLYNLVHASKTAFMGEKATKGVAYRFDWNEISQADKDAGLVKKGPNETIAGKDCEVYIREDKGIKSKFAGWNNITLLSEQESNGTKSTTKAIKVEEVPVPAEKLSVPADYTVKDK
jgi:hypothetical protein